MVDGTFYARMKIESLNLLKSPKKGTKVERSKAEGMKQFRL
jgi:hypothetical protein